MDYRNLIPNKNYRYERHGISFNCYFEQFRHPFYIFVVKEPSHPHNGDDFKMTENEIQDDIFEIEEEQKPSIEVKNKRCYIIGKIGDLPEEEYKANFEQAKREVEALGLEPVSPLDLPHNHGRTWSEYMREDLIALLCCGWVYAQRNWRQSPGGIIEVETAMKVGLNIIQQVQQPKK